MLILNQTVPRSRARAYRAGMCIKLSNTTLSANATEAESGVVWSRVRVGSRDHLKSATPGPISGSVAGPGTLCAQHVRQAWGPNHRAPETDHSRTETSFIVLIR